MRGIFPTWYASPLNQQAVTDLVVTQWLLQQVTTQYFAETDWTARIYETQNVAGYEHEMGFPPADRIGVSYIRSLRQLLDQFGLLQ